MARNEGFHWRRGTWRPTRRQREVLEQLVEGKTNAEIATRLDITVDGAKWHVGELLSQTGLSDRQALASWWQEERERRENAASWPAFFANPLMLGIAATLIAAFVIAGWLLFSGGGEDEAAPASQATGQDGGYLGGGELERSESLFEEFLVELIVEGGNGTSRVDLRDIATGERITSVEAGYRPMVLVRADAQELLVASGYQPLNDDGFTKLLEVYDLRDYSLQLKRTVPVPNRVNCTTFCQPMVLSRDERYLYYATRTIAPECGAGGDAAVCDIHAVVVLDLEDEQAPPVSTELARGCGVPRLAQSGESGAVVTCHGQYPVKGGFTQRIGPEGGEEVLDLGFGSPMHVFTTSDGRVVHLTEQGLVKVFGADGAYEGAQVLPPSDEVGFRPRVYYLGATELGEDRLFITFDDSAFVSHDQGFVVFDLRTMSIEGYGLVPGATAYLPQGEVVYVLRSGRLHILDLASGRFSELGGVAGGVEVLLPGR